MDTVKLEAKWPPDRRCTIEASEFGIYKEPDDGKRRFRGTDRATRFLLVVTLLAAAAIVVYFMFFDYTIPVTQAAASSSPIVNYAKYVKSKQSTAAATAHTTRNRSTDGLLGTMLAVKNSENYTTTTEDDEPRTVARRTDDEKSGAAGRHMRMYQVPPRWPAAPPYSSYGPDYGYWQTAVATTADKNGGRLEYSDGIYGFNRRSDFPQLAAYRAPFPPKSVVDVMKYVTGRPAGKSTPAPPREDYMVAQASDSVRYLPIQPAEEVNRFLPDAIAHKGNSKRFRNKFGPPVYLTPPRIAFPDDFMKPPSPDADYSMNFVATEMPPDVVGQDGSASDVRLHTDVVYHSPSTTRYFVPDSPTVVPKKAKKKKPKSKKPISVMLDIYPIPGHESENEQEDEEVEEDNEEENTDSNIHTALKSNLQPSDVNDILLRLKLLSKLNEGSRRLSKSLNIEQQDVQTPIIDLTTSNPLKDDEEEEEEEDEEKEEKDSNENFK